ncbi:heparan-sulfate 6-O-sulfotransferase 3-B-like [Physella acuta]|uniref:heparan-sulfate 6-O-sulfotransferase 3-B-like n=1 Tax=Physella acuta TaxID=109671 RepID=UPI0027DBEBB9|nr:heparan-sulfate 6-O-sulfotransferase 3-B-like [Physella acuta]
MLSKLRVASFVLLITVCGVFLVITDWSNSLFSNHKSLVSFLRNNINTKQYKNRIFTSTNENNVSFVFKTEDLVRDYKVDLNDKDVFVFLHIQKTGGTHFKRQLMSSLSSVPPCRGRSGASCECWAEGNRTWFFGWFTRGQKCGLHADWTELTACADPWFVEHEPNRSQRNYHYLTFLRNPVSRFLSEWLHVRRGAYWPKRYKCNQRYATREELHLCADGGPWLNVSFDDFIGCKYNLGFNRMTRMLANLSLVNCYNRTGLSERYIRETLLKSAKENLLAMDYFGLTEQQEASQFLFETTFSLSIDRKLRSSPVTRATNVTVTPEMRDTVVAKNLLDVELYSFAAELFRQRVRLKERELGVTTQQYFKKMVNRLTVLPRFKT